MRDPKTGRLVRWKRDEAGNLLRDSSGKLIPAQPKGVITRTPRSGAGSYAARRLARTEVSRAFNEGSRQAAELNPFVVGVKWNLSGTHKDADDCDAFAHGSSQGMEHGVYRADDAPAMPSHPHCRCFWTPETTDDTESVAAQLRRDFDLDPQPIDLV